MPPLGNRADISASAEFLHCSDIQIPRLHVVFVIMFLHFA
jgi:hypothetical protein